MPKNSHPISPSYGVSAVIPCRNEKNTIRQVIEQARRALVKMKLPHEIIVADNGSTDGSPVLAKAAGANVISVQEPGYGVTLNAGIFAARYEYVVFADADLSYPFDEMHRLLGPLLKNEADLVLGSRLEGKMEKGAMPLLHRYLGTPFLSFLIHRMHGLRVSDCNSGMRAIRKSCYHVLDLRSVGMEYSSEMLVKLRRAQLRYQEVPIPFRKDQRGRRPHLRPVRDGYRHLSFILSNAFD